MLILIHSGQTGVERGAYRAAQTANIPTAGFSSSDQRDEIGRLPEAVASTLTPCLERGSRAAARANLEIASALVVVVPDASEANRETGVAPLLAAARTKPIPYLVVDATTTDDRFSEFIAALPSTSGSTRVMITGPRGTRWHEGERVAWQLIARLGLE